MRKKSLLTKVIAMGAITTLFASTTAFAATPTFSTRTLYVAGDTSKVEVATTVTGLTANDEVTYLAGDSANPVYINQYTADSDTYTFKYTTTAAKLSTTPTIKMAKADSTFTNGEAVTAGAGENTNVPATQEFTFNVKVGDAAPVAVRVNPRDVANVTTPKIIKLTGVSVDVAKINTAKLDGNDVNITTAEGGINLTISNPLITINESNLEIIGKKSADLVITLTSTTVDPGVSYSTGVKANSYTYNYNDGSVNKTITGPMFAIYGNVKGDVTEYGIAVSFDGDFEVDETSKYKLYRAAESDANGEFGVAIIDDSEENPMTMAYAKLYYKIGGTTKFVGNTKIVNFK